MKENSDANIFCFYLTNRAKSNFNDIAKMGSDESKSVHLNVNNKDKSIASLQGASSETILFTMNTGDMSIVNKFREKNRNIPQFL